MDYRLLGGSGPHQLKTGTAFASHWSMDWFESTQRMGWLVIFWVASFVLFLAAFWWMTRKSPRHRLRSTHTRPGTGPHDISSPKPSA